MDNLTKYLTAPLISSAMVGLYEYYTHGKDANIALKDAMINFGAIAITEPIAQVLFDVNSISPIVNEQSENFRQYVRPLLASGIYSVYKLKDYNPLFTMNQLRPLTIENFSSSFVANVAGATAERSIKKIY